ncbi:unnamed protein product, partial [Clonostachys rhizophaga]
ITQQDKFFASLPVLSATALRVETTTFEAAGLSSQPHTPSQSLLLGDATMTVEVALNTPLADALNAAIQPKLVEAGWGNGDGNEASLAELIILMLANGNQEEQIAAELAGDLLGLSPEDSSARDFARWLFEQIDTINGQLNGTSQAGKDHADASYSGDMDTDMGSNDASGLNAPTGPRSMRNGNTRGGRDRRTMGNNARPNDRTPDSGLHRVRRQTGNERINTHTRGGGAQAGPRNGQGRFPRNNNRAATVQRGLDNWGNPDFNMMGQPDFNMMANQNFGNMPPELAELMKQQNQLIQNMASQFNNTFNNGSYGQGKPLSDRVQYPNKKNQHQRKAFGQKQDGANGEPSGEGDDVDMSGNKREPANPEESVCKYNLNCTNRECKFAHQSPAAPHGAPVDVNDVCTFGAACKNRKCVARHPSPATKLAHQSEQDCKFFPNCQNPRCPFKHPSMPLCRNGADCTTPGCKFTHVKTKCRFNPCLNPNCAFAHEEGQQGGFKDKVWVADSAKEHVSERKFVDEDGNTELVKPEDEGFPESSKEELDADVIV